MDREGFKPREKIDVENPEFLTEIRKKIVERIRTQYPANLISEDSKNFLDQFKNSETKTYIDSWAGDAFAWIAKQEYQLNFEEYEKARKLLFID